MLPGPGWTTWSSPPDPPSAASRGRPSALLTREAVRPFLARVTVAPLTTTIRGLSTEVNVGIANGLDNESVVKLRQHAHRPRRLLSDGASGTCSPRKSGIWRTQSETPSTWSKAGPGRTRTGATCGCSPSAPPRSRPSWNARRRSTRARGLTVASISINVIVSIRYRNDRRLQQCAGQQTSSQKEAQP